MTYTTRDIIECVTSCLTLNFKVKGQGHNINILMLNFAYENHMRSPTEYHAFHIKFIEDLQSHV